MDDRDKLGKVNAAADQLPETRAVVKRPKASDRRIQRLQDLRKEALDEPNPLRANLRAATADLLEIGYRLSAGIRAVMGSGSAGLEAYEEVLPAIGSMALVHRQATRYVQLDRDWVSEPEAGRGADIQPPTSSDDVGELKT